MGQHLIPQAHLEGFAARPGYLYVFDAAEARWNSDSPLPIAKVAQSKNLWDEETERDLAYAEHAAIPVIRKLCEEGASITLKEREKVAYYLAMMMSFRSPKTWSTIKDAVPELARPEMDGPAARRASPEEKRRVEEWLEREIQESRKGPYRGRSGLRSRSVTGVPRGLLNVTFNMRWTVLHAERGQFVISDAPVWMTSEIGIGNSSGHVWAPLSKSELLLADWGRPQRGEVRHRPTREASKYNRLIVGHAYRYVYSARKSDWIARVAEEMRDEALLREETRKLARRMGPVSKRREVLCPECGRSYQECACGLGLLHAPPGAAVYPAGQRGTRRLR